ncbi:DUF779 domain-containing protein [Kurthia sibirica]|uniref:DUF779 domain-containing protein n=1 Tax=Kurthia sibirica TaxID=202750 RepID=A0A2U3AMA9_9BACL|nr:DUF779 domain-containing protein [Kurthia sibirica]PWI25662.1 DUF779 domain-containing protein [Kurthia sibirica]GEK33667.1 hypothetical protein KSI01_12000 [Kurthia sibirica]
MVKRVEVTAAALELIRDLKTKHGAIMFHQSGGCCEGSAAMCYKQEDFKVGGVDVLLETLDGDVPFYMHEALYNYSKHTQIILDAIDGFGSGFSLESIDGKSFLSRSRMFTEDEYEEVKVLL